MIFVGLVRSGRRWLSDGGRPGCAPESPSQLSESAFRRSADGGRRRQLYDPPQKNFLCTAQKLRYFPIEQVRKRAVIEDPLLLSGLASLLFTSGFLGASKKSLFFSPQTNAPQLFLLFFVE